MASESLAESLSPDHPGHAFLMGKDLPIGRTAVIFAALEARRTPEDFSSPFGTIRIRHLARLSVQDLLDLKLTQPDVDQVVTYLAKVGLSLTEATVPPELTIVPPIEESSLQAVPLDTTAVEHVA